MKRFGHIRKVKQSPGDIIFMMIVYIILIFATIVTLFPFLDVVFSSLMSSKEMVESAKSVLAIPKHPTLDNYKYVLSGASIFHAYGTVSYTHLDVYKRQCRHLVLY